MALILLVRHGQTDENVSGKISGQGPVPLNARGQAQAKLAAETLEPLGVTHLISSPVVRARQTADILTERLLLPIVEELDLREVEYGDWEGKHFNEIRRDPMFQTALHDPVNTLFPNGESLPTVQKRGVQVIERLHRSHPQGVLALVSHGDVIRTAVAHFLGMTFNDYRRVTVDNGAISVIEMYTHQVHVKAVNFVPQVGRLWLESFYETWQKSQNLVAANGVRAGE